MILKFHLKHYSTSRCVQDRESYTPRITVLYNVYTFQSFFYTIFFFYFHLPFIALFIFLEFRCIFRIITIPRSVYLGARGITLYTKILYPNFFFFFTTVMCMRMYVDVYIFYRIKKKKKKFVAKLKFFYVCSLSWQRPCNLRHGSNPSFSGCSFFGTKLNLYPVGICKTKKIFSAT